MSDALKKPKMENTSTKSRANIKVIDGHIISHLVYNWEFLFEAQQQQQHKNGNIRMANKNPTKNGPTKNPSSNFIYYN